MLLVLGAGMWGLGSGVGTQQATSCTDSVPSWPTCLRYWIRHFGLCLSCTCWRTCLKYLDQTYKPTR
eukprot:9196852-Ditylum_brightwellii.AAC.1